MKAGKLTYESIITQIITICKKNGIKLILNDKDIPKDNGCAYGKDEIHMGSEYSTNLIMMAIFFHEMSHCMIYRRKSKKYRKLSIFDEESLAWILAMQNQKKYFRKSFTKSQGNFMLECLQTYSKQHYHFSKSYQDKEDEDDKED